MENTVKYVENQDFFWWREKVLSEQEKKTEKDSPIAPAETSLASPAPVIASPAPPNASLTKESTDEKITQLYGVGTKRYLAAQKIIAEVIKDPKKEIDDEKFSQETRIEKGTIQSVKSDLRKLGFPIVKNARGNKRRKIPNAPVTPAKAIAETPAEASLTPSTTSTPSKSFSEKLSENAPATVIPPKTPAEETAKAIVDPFAPQEVKEDTGKASPVTATPPRSIEDEKKLIREAIQEFAEQYGLQPKGKEETIAPVPPTKPPKNDGEEDAKRDDKIAERVSEKIIQKLMGGSQEKTEDGVIQEEVEITGDRIKWSGFIDPEVWMRYNIFKAVSAQQGKKWEGTLGDFFNIATRDVITSHGYYPTVIRTKGNKALIEFPINQDQGDS